MLVTSTGTALSLILQTEQGEDASLWQQLKEEGSPGFRKGSDGNAFSPDRGHVENRNNRGGWSESSAGGKQLCAMLLCVSVYHFFHLLAQLQRSAPARSLPLVALPDTLVSTADRAVTSSGEVRSITRWLST